MNKKEILSWLQQYGLAANKMYGQHFLFHEKYIEAIVTAISPCSADVVLEIGPGLGVLTQRLSEHAKKVIAVEIDAGFVEVLQSRFANNSRVTIVHNDFLKTNYWNSIAIHMKNNNRRCYKCGSKDDLVVHHMTYLNHGYEHLFLDDLVVLCSFCHNEIHKDNK